MDRLLYTQRSLVALCGLAGLLVSTGCRDRNLQVPPPAHYTDGEVSYPQGGGALQGGDYSGYDPGSGESSAVNPYDGASYGTPGTFDPSATPTSSGYDSLGYPIGSGSTGYDGPAGFGVPPMEGAEGGGGIGAAGPYASPSSTFSYENDPYGNLNASPEVLGVLPSVTESASPEPFTAADAISGTGNPAILPGIDSESGVPPIPDSLPDLP